MDYQNLLNIISEKYSNILSDNLVGIYVHGSIAFKCFNWNKSDIDFIVVINKKIDLDTEVRLLSVLSDLIPKAPLRGFEMSVVLKRYCTNFQYATPFELHFSNTWVDWYHRDVKDFCKNMYGEDKDLAAHFTVIRNVGVVLCGSPIKEVFGEVPRSDYIDSIKYDIENAKIDVFENTMYVILTLCRVLAYIKDNLVISKEQGGLWGLKNLPEEYNGLINKALLCYKSDEELNIDHETAQNFCDYMLTRIFNT